MLTRRSFLGRALCSAAASIIASDPRAQSVPNSLGDAPPQSPPLPGACDCHHHIYDADRFPGTQPNGRMIASARVEEYALLKRRLRLARSVVVTPLVYATDNGVTLNAIQRLGATRTRGIAVLDTAVTARQLKYLHDGGIRGIRFSLMHATAFTTQDMIEPLARRIADLGWHVRVNMTADQIASAASLWRRLPCPVIFDHMGHLPPPNGTNHPAFDVMRSVVDKGHGWIKVSVTFDNTADGPPEYADVSKVAQRFIEAAPERVIWGTNWPHPLEEKKPDDAVVFDLVSRWAMSEDVRRKILVRNPAVLYGFA